LTGTVGYIGTVNRTETIRASKLVEIWVSESHDHGGGVDRGGQGGEG